MLPKTPAHVMVGVQEELAVELLVEVVEGATVLLLEVLGSEQTKQRRL